MRWYSRILLSLLAMCSLIPMAKAQFDHLPDGEHYPALVNTATVRYGPGSKQKLFISRGKGQRAPLVVMLGSGDWNSNAGVDWLLLWNSLSAKGFAVTSVSTERANKVGRDAVLTDFTLAIHHLRKNAAKLKIDTDKMVLIGSGTGAAFTALLGLDPEISRSAGIPFESIRTVVLLDSDGLDANAMMRDATGKRRDELEQIFGKSTDERTARSAIGHVALPNVPSLHILAFPGPASRIEIAESFADKLKQAGTSVTFDSVPIKSVRRDSNAFGMLANSKTKALVEHLEKSLK